MKHETILKTRAYFADLCLGCIQEVLDGSVKVNDREKYFKQQIESYHNTLAGGNDHTFTHWQYANYIETGKCVALLP